jgi:hypothetical protein
VAERVVESSTEVGEGAWIADRLSPFDSGLRTSVIPSGFEAYARVLHPAEESRHGGRLVRWAEVAAWSGAALLSSSQFADVAFPEHEPAGPAPWSGRGPQTGCLRGADADVLVEVLAGFTGTPERCWFCVWEGYGPSSAGLRVRLPARDYLFYAGPIAAAQTFRDLKLHFPNLWWPADRAWCVASEIDLPWTYVGGSSALVNSLRDEPRIEAQLASPTDNHHQRAPDWQVQPIEQAVVELLDSGHAEVHTWRGTVRVHLERPAGGQHGGSLRTEREDPNGRRRSSGWMLVDERDPERLREVLTLSLTSAVIELAEH